MRDELLAVRLVPVVGDIGADFLAVRAVGGVRDVKVFFWCLSVRDERTEPPTASTKTTGPVSADRGDSMPMVTS